MRDRQAILGELVERRGYAYAFPTLPPRDTALVVVDPTDLFFGRTDSDLALAARLNDLGCALRAKRGAVMWVRPAPFAHAPMMRELLGSKRATMHAAAQQADDPRNQLAACLDVRADDLHVRKTLFSAFFPTSSPAEAMLKTRGIRYVVIGGVVTDVCVEATARDAFSCGFRTILLSDGCRGSSEQAHEAALDRFQRFFGDVRSTADVAGMLSTD